MANGVADRSQSFYDGSESARASLPTFQTYRRTSTLDNLFPTGNGMADQDRERVLMGIPRSPIGQSTNTFNQSIWLRNQGQDDQTAAALYDKTY